MVTAPCLVVKRAGFLLEVLQSFVFLEAASLGSVIIFATRAMNGAGGTRGTLEGIIYASSVEWISLLSLEIAARSDVVSTVLNAQACSACYFRVTLGTVIYAKVALRTSLQVLLIFLLQEMTVR